MEINTSLEEKLWSVSRNNPLDKETADQIIDYLLARLSDYLQQPLKLVGVNRTHADSFSTTLRGAISPQDAFRISFVGPLGMGMNYDKDEPHYSASLFLFGDHHRLAAGQPSRSYIELFYERGDDNIGNWRSLGWQTDDYWEFEDIEEDSYYYRED